MDVYRAIFETAKERKAELVKVEKYTFLEDGGGAYLYMRLLRAGRF
jgi:hypothetical protein